MSDMLFIGFLFCKDMKKISLVKLLAMYQREHPKMDMRDKLNTEKAFGIIEEMILNCTTHTFGKMQFLQFRNELIRRNYSRLYCNKLMCKVKAVFKWGATYDLCTVESYQNLRLIELVKYGEAREDVQRKDVDDVIIYETLKYLPPMMQDMVVFQRVTGMRPSEVCNMTAGSIHSLTYAGKQCFVCELEKHKTARYGKMRIIPLNDRAMEIVTPYLANKRLDEVVFVTDSQHVPWTVWHWDRVLATVIAKHHLPKWTLYQLRHTKGTELSIKEGVEVAADVLGNSVAVMSKIYDHGRIARLFQSIQNEPPESSDASTD